MEKDEFYIGYVEKVGTRTKKSLKRFVFLALSVVIVTALLFGFFQKPAVNSSFNFGNPTKVSGIYHESPYPMLRVPLAAGEYKDIVLLGVGKFGPNPYLKEIREKEGDIRNKALTIEGQLIYYNGKTLLEIDDGQKVSLGNLPQAEIVTEQLGVVEVEGEIVDPKCYFGVMKPGYGKIHRSCAALCILGGIPPVLVASDKDGMANYFLLTDLKGNPIHKDIIPYIGQPSFVQGAVQKTGDWHTMRIDVNQIKRMDKKSEIY
ncbi:hypothetical protein FGF1_07010 [Flavobacteriaceae bacterium GF1]